MMYFDNLPDDQKKLVEKHLELVIKANEKVNLTRIEDWEEGMMLHVEDSLSGLPELENSPNGLYGDMGSGGGYPAIPLSIASGRKAFLMDSRMKKMEVMKEIIQELGLGEQIDVYAGRAELLARTKSNEFSVLTARALAKLGVLLELASPLLKVKGRLICYKANVDKDEFDNSIAVAKQVGMKLVSDRSFLLGEEYQRRILCFEKVGKSRIKLPRKEGMAQKHPL